MRIDLGKTYPEFVQEFGFFTIRLEFCEIYMFDLPIVAPKVYQIGSMDSHQTENNFTTKYMCEYTFFYNSYIREATGTRMDLLPDWISFDTRVP